MPRLIPLFNSIIKRAELITNTDLRYVLGNGSWLLFGQVVGIVVGISLAVCYAHFLTKEVYGTYKYLLSVFGILSLFSLSGMEDASQRGIAEGKESIFWDAFKVRIKWSLLAFLSCAGIGFYYFTKGDQDLAMLFFASSPFLLLLEPISHYNSLLAGKKLFRKASLLNILLQVCSAVVMFVAIYFTKSSLGIVLAYLLGAIILRGSIFLYVIKKHTLNSENDPSLLRIGSHWSILGVVSTIVGRLDSVILFSMLGPVSLAVYSFAQSSSQYAQHAIKIITTSLAFPKMAAQDKEVIKKTLLRKVAIAHMFTIPIAIIMVLIMPSFFNLLFPQYLDSIPYAQALTALLAFAPLRLVSTAISVKASTKLLYWLNLTSAVLSISCLLIFVPIWGIWGVVISTATQQGLSNLLALYLFQKM